jgi:hypothetical protein
MNDTVIISQKRLTGNPWRQQECEWVLRWEKQIADLNSSNTILLYDWLLTQRSEYESAQLEEKTLEDDNSST